MTELSRRGHRMKRREVLAALVAVAALSGTARAQQLDRVRRVRRVGLLLSGSQQSHGAHVDALREGLRELGYVERRDFTLDLRWADGRMENLEALAGEL